MSSAPASSAGPTRFSSWRKIALWSLGIVLAFLTAIVVYDDKLEPYDDLKPTRTSVPDAGTNGYLFLKERWKNFQSPVAVIERWETMRKGTIPWDDEIVRKLNPRKNDFGAELGGALERPEWVAPPEVASFGFFQSWFFGPVTVLAAEALSQARQGDGTGALDLIAKLRQSSARQIHGSFNTADVLMGISLDHRALTLTCDVVTLFPGDRAIIDRAIRIWSTEALTPADLAEPIRAESAYFRQAFSKENRPQNDTRNVGVFDDFWKRWLIKPNRCWNNYHRVMRAAATGWLVPSPDGSGTGEAAVKSFHGDRPTNQVLFWLNPNIMGDFVTNNQLGFAEIVLGKSGRTCLFEGRAIRVWLAIKRFQLTNPNQIPSRVEELVPADLAELPVDPWNGKALTWDPTYELISAVGSDWLLRRPIKPASKRQWTESDGASPGLWLNLSPLPAPGFPKK